MGDMLITDIPKNSRERLRVQLREYKGRSFIDLRLFAVGAEGDLVPTRTGIGLRPDLLRSVIAALEEAEAAAKAEGLL